MLHPGGVKQPVGAMGRGQQLALEIAGVQRHRGVRDRAADALDLGGGEHQPGPDRSDEVGREADGGNARELRSCREQVHAAYGVEQHQGDAAVGDAVLAHVPLLHVQLQVGAVRRRQPRPVPDQALEGPGRRPLGVATELADDLADGFSPMLLLVGGPEKQRGARQGKRPFAALVCAGEPAPKRAATGRKAHEPADLGWRGVLYTSEDRARFAPCAAATC